MRASSRKEHPQTYQRFAEWLLAFFAESTLRSDDPGKRREDEGPGAIETFRARFLQIGSGFRKPMQLSDATASRGRPKEPFGRDGTTVVQHTPEFALQSLRQNA